MNPWRLFILMGLLKVRKERTVDSSTLLTDGDGAVLVDENGQSLTG